MARQPLAQQSPLALSSLNRPKVEEKDSPLYYIIPPMILLFIFLFCGLKLTQMPDDMPVANDTQRSKSTSTTSPAEVIKPALDLNAGLAAYVVPTGQKNLLAGAETSLSAGSANAGAELALNGKTEDKAAPAVANAEGGQAAWWKAELAEPQEVQSIVIYGGGPGNPHGKLYGGFEVTLETAAGLSISRKFCENGYALEGYELWKLPNAVGLKSITITSLNADYPLVLREVQAIGAQ